MSRADLLDINVWLALAHVHHPHHTAARQYWVSSTVPMVFCRTSVQGFLRLVTQPAVMGDAVHTPSEAWRIYTAHLRTGRSLLLPEPDGVDVLWQRLTCAENFHIRDWTDAYLASFAMCADCRLVSFDAGFAQYQGKEHGNPAVQGVRLEFLHLRAGLEAFNANH